MMKQARDYEQWKKMKSFLLSSLKTHGFGTPKSEEQIHRQLECFTADLEARNGKPYSDQELVDLFMKGATSVLMKMVAGLHFEYDDPELLDLIDKIKRYQKMWFDEAGIIFVLIDVLPWWLVRIVKRATLKKNAAVASEIRDIIQAHIDVSLRQM